MVILYTLHENSYQDIKYLTQLKDTSVYINSTNRCPCACTFCLRRTKEMSESNTLWLKEEPSVDMIIDELKKYDFKDIKEFVFCGFGEPLERIDDLMEVADYLKQTWPDISIRINTNGLANLIYKKDVTPMLKGRIDTVSVSLIAPTKEEYLELTRSRFGIDSFDEMLHFVTLSKMYVPNVVLTVVDIIGEDKIKECQKICDDLGVTLRIRPFEE